MAEAGKLGTALVQQQKELRERLKDVEQLQAEGELTPELRVKLGEIEKEYNDVARETARAFLPKQRIPSNETAGGSPYVPEGRDMERVIGDLARDVGLRLSSDVSARVAAATNGNQAIAASELEKFALFLMSRPWLLRGRTSATVLTGATNDVHSLRHMLTTFSRDRSAGVVERATGAPQCFSCGASTAKGSE